MNHAVQRQLSVAIENEPGRLAAICRVLAEQGINIRDISVLDSVEQGVIRLVPNDAALCKSLLIRAGLYVIEAEVLVLVLKDTPGRLAELAQALAEAQINIDYAYGTEDADEKRIRLILKVSNLSKAREVITSLAES